MIVNILQRRFGSALPHTFMDYDGPVVPSPKSVAVAFAAIAGLLVWIVGPLFVPDSNTYISNVVIRTAGYPLLIDICEWIAGTYGLHLVIFFQAMGWFWATFFLLFRLRVLLGISSGALLICGLIMLVPFVPPYAFPFRIMTEPMAFILICLWFERLVTAVVVGWSWRRIAVIGAICTALILVRPQFLYLPFFILLVGGVEAWRTEEWRILWKLVFVAVVALAVSNLADRSYRYAVAGDFRAVPFTGKQAIVLPLYFVGEDRISRIQDQEAKEVLLAMKARMRQQGFDQQGARRMLRTVHGYHAFYNKIAHGIAPHILQERGTTDLWEIDRQLLSLTFDLVKADPWTVTLSYVRSVIWLSYQSENFLLLNAGLALLLGALVIARRAPPRATTLFYALMFSLANVLAVSTVEPGMQRYNFYGYQIVVALMLGYIVSALNRPSVID